MRVLDLIARKRDGGRLTEAELAFLLEGYLEGQIPDYQMSAWLMAVYLRGMDDEETAALTKLMLQSGQQIDLSSIGRPTVDKHSTGGVGDKVSLILAPLLAAAGLVVGKLTGRGLGHTGGTIDKLESIPGFSTDLTHAQFLTQLQSVGLAMIGAGPELVPADRRLYALRDVTATVGSIPLIASSIMSKKLAGGAGHIVLDVKYGAGALMPDLDTARRLAGLMISIGRSAGRQVRAVLSDMSQPLGYAVGNSLEVKEAILALRGGGPDDVRELTLTLAAELLLMAGLSRDQVEAKRWLGSLLRDGSALGRFREFVAAQGGDISAIDDPLKLPLGEHHLAVLAPESGFVARLDALQIGRCAMQLGAGRERKEDVIDPGVGVVVKKKVGDFVHRGEPLAWLYGQDPAQLQDVSRLCLSAYQLTAEAQRPPRLVAEIIR
ncbi:MAG: thymidine phosphorylase [Bacillota bacterium]|jgi:pyrimidine-nucleoside phosphorylase